MTCLSSGRRLFFHDVLTTSVTLTVAELLVAERHAELLPHSDAMALHVALTLALEQQRRKCVDSFILRVAVDPGFFPKSKLAK